MLKILSNDMKDNQAEDMKDDNDKEHSTVSWPENYKNWMAHNIDIRR